MHVLSRVILESSQELAHSDCGKSLHASPSLHQVLSYMANNPFEEFAAHYQCPLSSFKYMLYT